jgi:hypothetical protein
MYYTVVLSLDIWIKICGECMFLHAAAAAVTPSTVGPESMTSPSMARQEAHVAGSTRGSGSQRWTALFSGQRVDQDGKTVLF